MNKSKQDYGKIIQISYQMATRFLLSRHYSGRKPGISKAFGWEIDNKIVAVCTFGTMASMQAPRVICGKKYAKNVIELNRLCRLDSLDLPLSYFVSRCLKILRQDNLIIISYSDMQMKHHGYIYQACNFLYTGVTIYDIRRYNNGKHSRSLNYINTCETVNYRELKSKKHRYIYFCTRSKRLKKEWIENLKYEILPYPKGENSYYKLGEFTKPKVIDIKTKKEIKIKKTNDNNNQLSIDNIIK